MQVRPRTDAHMGKDKYGKSKSRADCNDMYVS